MEMKFLQNKELKIMTRVKLRPRYVNNLLLHAKGIELHSTDGRVALSLFQHVCVPAM